MVYRLVLTSTYSTRAIRLTFAYNDYLLWHFERIIDGEDSPSPLIRRSWREFLKHFLHALNQILGVLVSVVGQRVARARGHPVSSTAFSPHWKLAIYRQDPERERR